MNRSERVSTARHDSDVRDLTTTPRASGNNVICGASTDASARASINLL